VVISLSEAREWSAGRRLGLTRSQERVAKFLVTGCLAFVVNEVVLLALYSFGLHFLPRDWHSFNVALFLSSLIAMAVSILVRFLINDRWTFPDRHGKSFPVRFWQSTLSSLGSPIIAILAVNLLSPLLGLSYLIANAIGVLLGLIWNWLCSDRLVWVQTAESPRAVGAR
jgi:putative flippase GtrA